MVPSMGQEDLVRPSLTVTNLNPREKTELDLDHVKWFLFPDDFELILRITV